MQLEPAAIHLDDIDRELPSRNEDWIIHRVTDNEVDIGEAVINGLSYTLGKDHIRNFTSNPNRSVNGGLQYGFLTLLVQLYIQGNSITFRPCLRPGERVPPLPVQLERTWVDFRYPSDSGLQGGLHSLGYRVAWCRDSLLARRELEGYEVVVEKNARGVPMTFHLRDRPENQVLIKRRVEKTAYDSACAANELVWRP